jgi:predicted permease
MLEIFFIVLPIFIVLFLGNILRRMKLMDDTFIKSSNKLIFNITLPALLFYKISGASLETLFDWRLVVIIFVSVFLIFVLSFVLAKALRFPNDITGSFMMNNFRGNYANMGLPVCYYVFGNEGLLYASVLMAFIVPYVSMLAIISLSICSDEKKHILPMLKTSLLNPLAIACIAGLAYSAIGIPMPEFIIKSFGIVSDITLPLALFCVGATITVAAMKNDLFVSLLSSAVKMIGVPAAAYAMIKIWGIPMDTGAKTLVILLSAPSGTVNVVFASAMGGNVRLTASTIVTTTTISILTFIMWLTIVGV